MSEFDREGRQSVSSGSKAANTLRLPQIKTSPLWLWSIPGDLRETTQPPPPLKEGVRNKGPTRFPESS